MDVSRLKKKNLVVWLPLDDEVDVLCRHVDQTEFEALGDEATEKRFDRKTHQYVKNRDEKKFRSLLGRAVVQDWRGIEEDGEDYPCSSENIDYLMEHSTEFRLLIMDTPLSFNLMVAAEKEAERKNSGTGLKPKHTTPE